MMKRWRNFILLNAMRYLEFVETFAVRGPGPAFPALEFENVSLDPNGSFVKCKAGHLNLARGRGELTDAGPRRRLRGR